MTTLDTAAGIDRTALAIVTEDPLAVVAEREHLDLALLKVKNHQFSGYVRRGDDEVEQVKSLFLAHFPQAIRVTDFRCYLSPLDSLSSVYRTDGRVLLRY